MSSIVSKTIQLNETCGSFEKIHKAFDEYSMITYQNFVKADSLLLKPKDLTQ